MNQQCKVCGEPAAGFHFGAFTCEGCKSFFGRTYNNLSSISECKNNGDCVINKKNRTACKACRLKKCVLVGMSKSGSRYGRRSNWFKIHCLLQEQQQQQLQKNPSTGDLITNPFLPTNFLTNLCTTNSSPSDSGASSADLEENCIKDGTIDDNCLEITKLNNNRNDKTSQIRLNNNIRKQTIHQPPLVDNLKDKIDPLRSYIPRTVSRNLNIPPFIMPTIPPNLLFSIVPKEQDEPIDLSVKSRKRSRTVTPEAHNTSIDDDDDDDGDGNDETLNKRITTAADVLSISNLTGKKPKPLDLTLLNRTL